MREDICHATSTDCTDNGSQIMPFNRPCSLLWGGLNTEYEDIQSIEEPTIIPTTTVEAISTILMSGKVYIVRMGCYREDRSIEELVSYYPDKGGAIRHIFGNLNYHPSNLYSLTYEVYDIEKKETKTIPIYKKGVLE